ncbi:SusD/RagB family nutrient-binding outer membrane lipoprotein [Hymenobacter psychrophilus]|uniref:Starch-binding associating with outer membrane n=1 Tax=Hymenobacter psychrophilus TaxID=651662 RepID=A0A1H3FN60_9BACT|nr:SusD/RagB family nutrient-binding outer membrane lipoprotein [Hymenobacter psychrophilus]SDX92237.1 Starch-binding associating with outer membrane [Hymenobacter psychrophilus]
MTFLFKRNALLATLGLSLGLASCDSYLDVNDNPNTPTSAPASQLLPNGILRTAVVTGNTLNVLGNLYAGNWAQAQDFLFYVPEQSYQLTSTSYSSIWDELYAGSLPDLNVIVQTSKANGDKNSLAIARIMQAYNYQLLVDAHGDVPFTDALQGVSLLAPRFDKDVDVYTGLITLLDEALANITPTAAAPSAGDIIFRSAGTNEMVRWRQFANTLKLRIYLRQSGARPAVAEAGIKAMQAANADFLGPGVQVGVNPGFLNSAGKVNPLVARVGYTVTGAVTSGSRATRANTLALNYLKVTNDTLRLKQLYTKPATPATLPNNVKNYRGIQSGANPAGTLGYQAVLSPLGPGVIRPFAQNGFAQPVYLMTAAESYFLQAEAVQRGWLTGSAQTLYETGIKESFKLLGLTEAQATTYYSQTAAVNPVINDVVVGGSFDTKAISPNFTAAANKIEAIINQKWIANNGINGFEAWTEYRRTGFPKGNYISLNAATQAFPVRLPYPQSEISNNPNTPVGVTIFSPKIFWDVD